MAIAQLTHLHISIPASGAPPGEVPEDCFPHGLLSQGPADPHRVSFTSGVTVLGGETTLEQSPDQIPVDRPDVQLHDPVCPDIPEDGDMDISIAEPDVPITVLQPPPGFLHFSWLREEWELDGDPSLFDFSKKLPGWFPRGYRGQSVDPPSLPISPIIHDSLDDSVVANVGSSRDESNTLSEANNVPKTVVEAMPFRMDFLPDILVDSPPPDVPDRYRCRQLRLSLISRTV